jgi:hypothetical protein
MEPRREGCRCGTATRTHEGPTAAGVETSGVNDGTGHFGAPGGFTSSVHTRPWAVQRPVADFNAAYTLWPALSTPANATARPPGNPTRTLRLLERGRSQRVPGTLCDPVATTFSDFSPVGGVLRTHTLDPRSSRWRPGPSRDRDACPDELAAAARITDRLQGHFGAPRERIWPVPCLRSTRSGDLNARQPHRHRGGAGTSGDCRCSWRTATGGCPAARRRYMSRRPCGTWRPPTLSI